MKTLWTFGDSFTADFGKNAAPCIVEYVNYKKYVPKTYAEFLSEKLSCNLKNLGHGGIDNYTILEIINNNKFKISDDDIIIIGWAPPTRFRIVENQSWVSVNGVSSIDGYFCENVSNKTILEILNNRSHKNFTDELITLSEIVTYMFKNNKTINWFWHFDGFYMNFETIKEETKGEINDLHWSENGHKDFAEWLLKNKL